MKRAINCTLITLNEPSFLQTTIIITMMTKQGMTGRKLHVQKAGDYKLRPASFTPLKWGRKLLQSWESAIEVDGFSVICYR